MKKSFILSTIVFTLILQGCMHNMDRDFDTVIKVDEQSVTSPKDVHSIGLIQNVDLVGLDNDSVLISAIDNIIVNDTLIYLLDNSKKQCVYIYTLKGRYVNTVSRQGKGKNEYINISDIFIDKRDNSLNILSRADSKILSFNSEGRELYKVSKLPKTFTAILPLENGYIGYMGNYTESKDSPYNFWTLDDSLKITGHFRGINPVIESRNNSSIHVLSSYGQEVDVISEMSYDVSFIQNAGKGGQKLCQFDFSSYNLPSGITKQQIDDPAENFKLHNNYVCDIYRFQQTDSHYLALFINQGQERLAVYDKQTGICEVASLEPYTGKYLCGFGLIKGINEEYIIAVEDAKTIYEIWKGKNKYNDFEAQYPQQVKNMRQKFSSINPEGNPFLIFYKVK